MLWKEHLELKENRYTMCTRDKPLRKSRGSGNKSVELCFIKI